MGMATEFDISKHSTCHDIHDDRVWVDHYKLKRRSGSNMGSKKSDECCEVEYDSDANMITEVSRLGCPSFRNPNCSLSAAMTWLFTTFNN
jgi:hypothetical protein